MSSDNVAGERRPFSLAASRVAERSILTQNRPNVSRTALSLNTPWTPILWVDEVAAVCAVSFAQIIDDRLSTSLVEPDPTVARLLLTQIALGLGAGGMRLGLYFREGVVEVRAHQTELPAGSAA